MAWGQGRRREPSSQPWETFRWDASWDVPPTPSVRSSAGLVLRGQPGHVPRRRTACFPFPATRSLALHGLESAGICGADVACDSRALTGYDVVLSPVAGGYVNIESIHSSMIFQKKKTKVSSNKTWSAATCSEVAGWGHRSPGAQSHKKLHQRHHPRAY